MRKFVNILIITIVLGLGIFFFWRYYFVFGEGTKAGELNFFVKKGYIFKTYEGRLIQTGFRSAAPGNLQSNEFDFSVANERVAAQIMNNSGKFFELHYKEYLGSLPWRGNSEFIVDSIMKIQDVQPGRTGGIQ
ncbi:hypothetical protein [Pinibacter aurantiacus]|uniref:6-phosphogluconate dehydrogenase n=1 Tax=Pinibacter aurantiacus TaxID=2851599 RepID=A0A9E2W2Z8_9BACT|nr:hypothetical protein [Pinibacter aurantiacus]MBV4356314.1 hypothetical protein [Pinibacter aurantiacus]